MPHSVAGNDGNVKRRAVRKYRQFTPAGHAAKDPRQATIDQAPLPPRAIAAPEAPKIKMSNQVFPNPPTIKGLTWTITRAYNFNTLAQDSSNEYTTTVAQTQNPFWHYVLMYDYIYGTFNSPNNTKPNLPYTDFEFFLGFLLSLKGKYASFLFNDSFSPDNAVGPATFTTGWSASTQYWIGASILDSGNHWQQVTSVTTGISGSSVPTFNHSGSTTTDGGVTWTDRGSGYGSTGVPNSGGGYVNGAAVKPAALQVFNDGAGNYYSPVQRNMGGLFWEDITDLNPASTISVYANAASTAAYSLVGPGLAIPGYSWMGLVLQWTSPVQWASTHTYSMGNQILDPAGHIQQVTSAGTSGSSTPVWNDSGSTTTDGTVTWQDEGYNPGPAASGPITAAFNFYFRMRLATDSQDFEEFMGGLWTIGGQGSKNGSGQLKIQTARPPGV